MAQLDGGVLTVLFVAGTDLVALFISHQWQVMAAWKGAPGKLDRRAGIQQSDATDKNPPIIRTVGAHQITSTACAPAPISSPIGASDSPSSAPAVRQAS